MIEKIELFDERTIALTPDQLSRANLAFYTRLLSSFSKACKNYQRQRLKERKALADYFPSEIYEGKMLGYYEDGRNVKDLEAMEEIYLAGSFGAITNSEAKERWGSDGGIYRELVYQLHPSIERSKEAILLEAQKWSPRKTIKLAFNAASLFPSLSEGQRSRLLLLAGYSPEEISKIAVRLGLSAALSFSLGQAYEIIGMSSAALGGALRFNQSLEAVLASYALYYGVMMVNAEINLRLLKDKNIATSPNLIATVAYYLLDRLLPKEEKMKSRTSILNWSTRTASLLMEPVKEVGWAATVFIPEVGMSMITAANLAGFGLNSLQAVFARKMVRPEVQDSLQKTFNKHLNFIQHPFQR